MKKKAVLRVLGIGIFHSILYLYIVPFIIYPKFGHSGFMFAVILAVIISIAVLGTIFLNKRKGDRNE